MRRRGFTLIELVITVAIVSLLATVAVPLAQLTVQRGKEQELKRALWQMREAIDAYKRAYDDGRIVRQAGRSGYPATLELLVEGVVDVRSPERKKIYFLRRLPRDPMAPADSAYQWGTRSYASPHDAPAEGDDVYDVHARSEGVGLNGIPYRLW